MGQGGRVVLINGTENAWIKKDEHTYQMNHFKFPDRIEPGSSVTCYIEWNQQIFKNPSDDSGEVLYEIQNLNLQFLVGAEAKKGFDLYVKYDNLSNLGSNYIHLGFNHDGFMPFVLSGRNGKFISTGSNKGASNWMSANLDLIGNCLLKDLSLSGSHDSGMSQIRSPTAFVNSGNTQTQSVEILEQLARGIRYFDIRPIIGGSQFWTGHYSKVGPGWQGARGQIIETIISQINEFTANNRELIIIKLSHSLNTDVGNSKYRPLNQDEFDRLFNELKNINNLFISSNDAINLLDKPLNYFLSSGKSAVVIVLDDNANLGSFYHQGFYKSEEFAVVDDFANSNNLNKMIDDQLNKMAENRSKSNKNFFVISWILTLQGAQNVFGPSIEYLAHQANTSIHRLILDSNLKNLISKGYPNVIYQDFVGPDITALAFAINLFRNQTSFIRFDKKQFLAINSKFELQKYKKKFMFAFILYLFMIVVVILIVYVNNYINQQGTF